MRKKHLSEQDIAASKPNTQPSIEYYSVRLAIHAYFVIRVYVELQRIEINNIIRVVKYDECDEYFKL